MNHRQKHDETQGQPAAAPRRLRLHRETLRVLSDHALAAVPGGTSWGQSARSKSKLHGHGCLEADVP